MILRFHGRGRRSAWREFRQEVLHEEVAKCGVLLAVIGTQLAPMCVTSTEKPVVSKKPDDFVRIEDRGGGFNRDIPCDPSDPLSPTAQGFQRPLSGPRNSQSLRCATGAMSVTPRSTTTWNKLIRGPTVIGLESLSWPPASPLPPKYDRQ